MATAEVIETKGNREVPSKIISDLFLSEGLLVYIGEFSPDSPCEPSGIGPLRNAAGRRAPLEDHLSGREGSTSLEGTCAPSVPRELSRQSNQPTSSSFAPTVLSPHRPARTPSSNLRLRLSHREMKP